MNFIGIYMVEPALIAIEKKTFPIVFTMEVLMKMINFYTTYYVFYSILLVYFMLIKEKQGIKCFKLLAVCLYGLTFVLTKILYYRQ